MRIQPLFEVGGLYAFLALALLGWGAMLAYQWRSTWRLSDEVYDARREQGALAPHVERDAFRRAYMTAEAPRRTLYMFIAALVCTLALPPLMLMFSEVWYVIWTWTGRFEPAANDTMIHTFGLFVFSVGVMIGVLWLALSRYYSNLPPVLEDEVAKLNRGTS